MSPQLEFFGAAGEVTGSCHILRAGAATLLLDCGLIQGGERPDLRNRREFPFDPTRIDAVVLSHAHIDHCGRLPLLYRRGFRGPIHATRPCRDLARILLADSAHMAARDAERENRRRAETGRGERAEALYASEDAERTMRLFRVHGYDAAFEIAPGVELRFHDAGHIMGSASVWLRLAEAGVVRHVVFSGDVGQYDSPILRDPQTDPELPVDLVLMESTYGDRRHRERADTLRELGAILAAAKRDGGNVLIPAFAVGRSQDLLYELGRHYDEWRLDDWQVFLDSPMAIDASAVYWRHHEHFDEDASALRLRAGAFPPLPNLRLCRTAAESMAINRLKHGAIMIAGSGMCAGGRIVHHLKHNLPRPECDIVFTGFQAQGTPGRAIVDRHDYVRIHGNPVRVAARVHTLGGFSAHGDQQDLLRWHAALPGRPPVWLVHGESGAATALRDALRDQGTRAEVASPGLRLDLGRPADVRP
jgi:metallo-beta-lactamase family protein